VPELADSPPPPPIADERELLLSWLAYLRNSILRKLEDLSEEQARWTPGGALISVLGVVNHLTHVETRWLDGKMLGTETSRSEAEFHPGPGLTVTGAAAAYRSRGEETARIVRRLPIAEPCRDGSGRDLRWVLLHMIEEAARHAGHADATRELLDGTTGT
jgi:uncharacterized damage-inducible protein DinB